MVKANAKHDYYADLDLPASADAEAIKKQFRLLAKQYHPDRNPGRETEVVAKFQAVQAAHEILSDLQQKSKYDAERAKYIKKQEPDPYSFRRSYTAKATAATTTTASPAFSAPPRSRNASVDRAHFDHGRSPPSSASAEKFAAFTRPVPSQWDRAKFEEAAAKAEALRSFQSMRGQPQPPPKPARAPTAPRPGSTASSSEHVNVGGTTPGFPGMSQTQRRQGFSPAAAWSDEPPAKSAYAYVHSNRDKAPPAAYANQDHVHSMPPTSPNSPRVYPGSPLKSSYTSGGNNMKKPGLGRTSSRYASSGGEKTDIGAGLGRSVSGRNSPIHSKFPDHGPFGARAQSSQEFRPPLARHRSASPKARPQDGVPLEYSATDTSSSEDESANVKARPKAVPRQFYNAHHGRSSSNEPALTGHFSNKNYTKVVDDTHYAYPPPEARDAPYRKSFEPFASPVDDITNGLDASGIRNSQRDSPRMSHATPHINESQDRSEGNTHHHQSFSASDWDRKFSDGQNIFTPNERDRRSPTKSSRSRQSQRGRQPASDTADDPSSDSSRTDPANQSTDSTTSPTKASAFKAGTFSADDWAHHYKFKNNGTASNSRSPQKHFPQSDGVEDHLEAQKQAADDTGDAMDIDSNETDTSKGVPKIHVKPPSRPVSGSDAFAASSADSRQGRNGGVKLAELAETAPFKSAAGGLSSLSDDLSSSLPFKSRAANQVSASDRPGSTLKGMGLPKPPQPILPPESLTQASWESYWKKMQKYMQDWNIFNTRMIDHFRIRQEQINHSMYQNWVMGEGDGADADDFDDPDDLTSRPLSSGSANSSSSNEKSKGKAGYSTYMQWLQQDAMCRSRWDLAFEEHRQCLEGLGTTRRTVKALRARES